MNRYPVQNLLDATGLTLNGFIRTLMPSVNGVYYRKARDEGLTADQADRWAVAAGLHPFEVWPELVDDALELAERECAADDCTVAFFPVQPSQRYCSPTCSSRHRRRLRYQTDPTYRDRRRAASAAYYDENGDYVRRRNAAAKAMYRRRESA